MSFESRGGSIRPDDLGGLMIWIMALPSILLQMASVIFGISLLYIAFILIHSFLQHIKFYVESLFQPKIISVPLSDHEIKQKYRDMDNQENGYNPMRQDYAPIELFPKAPQLELIKKYGSRLFPALAFKERSGVPSYQVAKDYFLLMLIERTRLIDRGHWTVEKENKWMSFPFRPKQMTEMDSHYMDFLYNKADYKNITQAC